MQPPPSASAAPAAPDDVQLLLDLRRRFDAVALGVHLPGCYNPGCTNRGGVSEEALQTRTCSRCMAAQYCSRECSKAHWRWHKVSCKAASMALGGDP